MAVECPDRLLRIVARGSRRIPILICALMLQGGCDSSTSKDEGDGQLAVLVHNGDGPPSADRKVQPSASRRTRSERISAVWLDVQRVEVCGDTPCRTVGGPRVIELMALAEGRSELLGTVDLPPGGVHQVRLVLGSSNGVMVDGEAHELKVPSGMQSGLKFVGDWSVSAGQRTVLVVDFDPIESIVLAPGQGYILKPVVKIHDAAVPTGSVETVVLSESGGQLRVGDSLVLEVPPGAVSSNTVLWAQEIKAPAPTSTFILGPDGTQFHVPATIRLRFDATLLPAGVAPTDLVVLQDGQPIPTEVYPDEATLVAQVFHFSEYKAGTLQGPIVVANPPAPTPPGTLSMEESDPRVEVRGPPGYWHTAPIGSSNAMSWTYNNDAAHGVENYRIYHFTGVPPGRWEFQAFIPRDKANTRNACYEIQVPGAPARAVLVDQSPIFDAWAHLATVDIVAPGFADIALSDLTGEPWARYWVGFDQVRLVPKALDVPLDLGTRRCTTKVFRTDGPAPGQVRLMTDVRLPYRPWFLVVEGSTEQEALVDVVVFTGEAANVLRALTADGYKVTLALLAAMQLDGIIAAALASEGDIVEFIERVQQTGASGLALETILDDITGRWGEPLALLSQTLLAAWQANNVSEVIASSSGDVYVILSKYPRFQLATSRSYPSGWVFAADDLSTTTLSLIGPSKAVHFASADEAERNPDGFTLGKANTIWAFPVTMRVPVPNNYSYRWFNSTWVAP